MKTRIVVDSAASLYALDGVDFACVPLKVITDDAEYIVVAFGSIARISLKAIEDLREQGVKIGLIRPITLWPFPSQEIERLASKAKGILVVEINAGQMIEDVRLACHDSIPVCHFGRLGGIVPSPQEIIDAFFNQFPQANKPS